MDVSLLSDQYENFIAPLLTTWNLIVVVFRLVILDFIPVIRVLLFPCPWVTAASRPL
jgi:hypothetical protein